MVKVELNIMRGKQQKPNSWGIGICLIILCLWKSDE